MKGGKAEGSFTGGSVSGYGGKSAVLPDRPSFIGVIGGGGCGVGIREDSCSSGGLGRLW